MRDVRPVLARVLVLALGAAICSLITGLVALYTHGRSLPPSDGAYGMSMWDSLGDPFVRLAWLMMTCVGACIGFAVSVWALWRVKLTRAVPVVAAVTVSSAALSAPALGPAAAVVALVTGVATMLWCRNKSGWGSIKPL